MDHDPDHASATSQMVRLALALNTLRDTLTLMSMALSDMLTDSESTERDATLTEVREYLHHIHEPEHAKGMPADGS